MDNSESRLAADWCECCHDALDLMRRAPDSSTWQRNLKAPAATVAPA